MGTLYYAVGKTNRQAMEMGKDSFDFLKGRKFDHASLVDSLTQHFKEGFYSEECQEVSYVEQVAHKLLSIDNEFEVVSESRPSKEYEGIKITMSRYSETECIGDLLSTHLDV